MSAVFRARLRGFRPVGAANLGKPPTGDIKLMQLICELSLGAIALPTAAFMKLDEMRPPTLGKSEPFARDTVVRVQLPCRHLLA